jgi:hypothetical protein
MAQGANQHEEMLLEASLSLAVRLGGSISSLVPSLPTFSSCKISCFFGSYGFSVFQDVATVLLARTLSAEQLR